MISIPALDRTEARLRRLVNRTPGAELERKRVSLAVHVRRVSPDLVSAVEEELGEIGRGQSDLRLSHGRKVYELRPAVDWDKGRAVEWILKMLQLKRTETLLLYIGDDVTDEDVFHILEEDGVPITVQGGPERTYARYSLADPDVVREYLDRFERTAMEARRCRGGS